MARSSVVPDFKLLRLHAFFSCQLSNLETFWDLDIWWSRQVCVPSVCHRTLALTSQECHLQGAGSSADCRCQNPARCWASFWSFDSQSSLCWNSGLFCRFSFHCPVISGCHASGGTSGSPFCCAFCRTRVTFSMSCRLFCAWSLLRPWWWLTVFEEAADYLWFSETFDLLNFPWNFCCQKKW